MFVFGGFFFFFGFGVFCFVLWSIFFFFFYFVCFCVFCWVFVGLLGFFGGVTTITFLLLYLSKYFNAIK